MKDGGGAGAKGAPAPTRGPGSRQLACEHCRRSKLKCEMIFPCERCLRLGLFCEDPQASEEEDWLTKQLTVRHGLSAWLQSEPDTFADQAQRQRSRPRRVNRTRAMSVLRTVLHVYRDLSLEALRPMLEAWAEGLRVDLTHTLQDLGSAVGATPASSAALPRVPSLDLNPVSQPAGPDATSLLRPYLQKFFTEAFISVAAVYHKGQVTVFGNGNWSKSMHTPQQLQHRLHVEGHLPEAIFSSVVKPRDRYHLASCLDTCVFGSEAPEAEVIQVMECIQPWTNNPFNGLIGLRVVVEEGYLGMVMAVQVIPIPVCLEPSTHHRSNFMSMEKIIEALLSKRRKRAISATTNGSSGGSGSSACAAILEGLRRGRSRTCRHDCDHTSHSSGKTIVQPPLDKGGQVEEDWRGHEGEGREYTRPQVEVSVVAPAAEAEVPPGLALEQGATPSKTAFDDSSLLDDLTDDDGGNRDSTVDADLDNWPLDLEELDGLPFMRMHTSPTQGLDLPPSTTTTSMSSHVATGGGGMPSMHMHMLPAILPNLQGPMMGEVGERRLPLPGSAFPGPMRGPAEARGLPHPHAMGWTTEDCYLVDDSNRDSSTTIASEDFKPGLGGRGPDGQMEDMYRFLPWMEVDPPNCAVGGRAAIMSMAPPIGLAGNHALQQHPLMDGPVHQQVELQGAEGDVRGAAPIFPSSHEW